MNELEALVERVEKAMGPDRELDASICDEIGWWPKGYDRIDVYSPHRRWCDWKGGAGNKLSDHIDAPAFTASIDVAMSLIPDGLFPTIDFVTKRCWIRDAKGYDVLHGPAFGFAQTVPLSLVAAALKARASMV